MSTVKNILTPHPHPATVVYPTDRSKAVVPVFILLCVTLWFILRGASCFKVFPCSLSSCFVIPFSIVITSLGERELVRVISCICFFALYVLVFVFFSLPLGVGGGCVCYCVTPRTFLLTFLKQRTNYRFVLFLSGIYFRTENVLIFLIIRIVTGVTFK